MRAPENSRTFSCCTYSICWVNVACYHLKHCNVSESLMIHSWNWNKDVSINITEVLLLGKTKYMIHWLIIWTSFNLYVRIYTYFIELHPPFVLETKSMYFLFVGKFLLEVYQTIERLKSVSLFFSHLFLEVSVL